MLFINLIPCHRKKIYKFSWPLVCITNLSNIWGVESGNTMSAIVVLFIIGENQKKIYILLMLFI